MYYIITACLALIAILMLHEPLQVCMIISNFKLLLSSFEIVVTYLRNWITLNISLLVIGQLHSSGLIEWEAQATRYHLSSLRIESTTLVVKSEELHSNQNLQSLLGYANIVMIPQLVPSFFLGLLFLFTDDTSIFTNYLMLLYDYSSFCHHDYSFI